MPQVARIYRPYLQRDGSRLLLLLVTTGALAGLLSVLIDGTVTALNNQMLRAVSAVDSRGAGFVIWTACVLAILMTAAAITFYFEPGAAGVFLIRCFCIYCDVVLVGWTCGIR